MELAGKGLSEDALASIAASIELTTITDPESAERQLEVKLARRRALRSYALSLATVDFVRVHLGNLVSREQYAVIARAELDKP